MALVVKDRVQETTTTEGTGTLTLNGAVTGFQTFSTAIGNTNTTYYAIFGGSEWEVGIGTVGAGTLARTTILSSSNGGSVVTLSAGTKNVFVTYPASKSVNLDSSNNLDLTGVPIVSSSNGNITLQPNGTGDVVLSADTVKIGDANTDAVLTTDGTGDITISTNSGSNSGTVKIFDGVNGNIEITPNGSGVVKLDGLSYPIADGTAGQVLQTNGSGVLSFASAAGIAWQSVQTSGFTAVAGRGYFCNTTSSAFTVTLPATPSIGDQVIFLDYAGTWDTNAITINPNGNKILGQVSNVTATKDREAITLTYTDATQGWLPSSGYQESTQGLNAPYSVDFLVIAGGGGGASGYGNGDGTGGAGAGGYRTSFSTSGGGSPAESKAQFVQGITYTITVGAGGPGGTLNRGPNEGGQNGTAGTDSSITGSGFSTITSTGGGFSSRTTNGGNGGSGGGGGVGTGGLGTANQGFNGGNYTPSASPFQGGGGGGAGAVGVGGTGSAPATGVGGAGVASTITGPSVTRAGGGGGGRFNGSSSGTGGAGGGGAGGGSTGAGGNGTVNTGSGGGGGGSPATGGTGGVGGNGGLGVIILRMPTANYSAVTTGSPTVTTSGADTIIVFNGSGSIRG
jgi:hypothetical protein